MQIRGKISDKHVVNIIFPYIVKGANNRITLIIQLVHVLQTTGTICFVLQYIVVFSLQSHLLINNDLVVKVVFSKLDNFLSTLLRSYNCVSILVQCAFVF